MESLEHRVAATDHYDGALAAELEQAAQIAHAGGDFRQAGQMYRWASELSNDAALRNRRWLDAVIDMILARDVAWVRQQLPAVRSAPDLGRRAVIQGLMFGVEKRWLDAWATYTSVSEVVLDAGGPGCPLPPSGPDGLVDDLRRARPRRARGAADPGSKRAGP